MTGTYQIGPLVLDTQACVVVLDGAPIALGKRAVAVLAELVRSAPQLVPKSRIIEAAWPGLVVEEGNLAVQISSIRHALAQVSGGENWLQTVVGRGYRFVGPVARLPANTAPLAPHGGPHTNLPEPLTSFVGREREHAEIERLLSTSRLLTLTGIGGVGKTRLALHVAGRAADGYADGARLVELAALRDPDLVSQAAITALGLKEQPGRPMLDTLTGHLRSMRLLLVLDNAEHLLAPCARMAEAVLRQCPGVTIVVTSREPLGVPGEAVYRVPPLSVPDGQGGGTLQAAMDYESVRLFGERAKLHQFALDAENVDVIADICRRLDGNALAIELAAARVRSMSVQEIQQRLDERFSLLTGGPRTLSPRQQTLRGAIDWSYDLLTDVEKKSFCATSVFAGGFTLEAAEQVCAGEAIAPGGMLDLLTSLVDKSLLVAEQRGAQTRYRLLDTVQAYAAERLRTQADASRWHSRHQAHFFALAEAAEPQLTGIDQRKWLDRLEVEHDNMRAALSRSMLRGDAEAGLRLASALSRFWLVRGYLAEGRGWLSRLLAAAPGADPATRAKALNWAGILAWKQGDYVAARDFYERCLAIRRQLGDRKGIGVVLNNQGLLAYEQGDYRAARTLHEESLAIDREQGDRWGVAVSLIHLASLAMMQGDYGSARRLNEEGLEIFRAFGDRGHVANALRSLGNLHSHEGDDEAARRLYDESLAICRELGDKSGVAGALHGLGVSTQHAGDLGRARELLEQSLDIYRQLGDREGTARSLNSVARAVAAGGDPASAGMCARESLAIYRELGDRSGLASAIEGLAVIASASGEHREAARLWGASERLREEIGAPIAPGERAGHDRAVAAARAASADAAAFEAAWREGRASTLDRLIERALNREAPR